MKYSEIDNFGGAVGIYLITNLKNRHCYVGQTSQLFKKRWKDHYYAATCNRGGEKDTPLHKAIRKYGIEQFDFKVLEYCSIEELDVREQYWIDIFSANQHENYNQTVGGCGSHKLSAEIVKEIYNDILYTELSLTNIGRKYNISDNLIGAINNGTAYTQPNYHFPLRHKYIISGLYQIVDLLLNSDKSMNEIAQLTNTSLSKVKRVNQGHNNYHIDGYVYPLRVTQCMNEKTWQAIVEDLLNTNLTYAELGIKYNVSASTISKLNKGERNRHTNVDYPIRK